MEDIFIREDHPDQEAVAMLKAAVYRYQRWCVENGLEIVPVDGMKVKADARTYTLYDRQQGGIVTGEVADLLSDLPSALRAVRESNP
jgi:hypothetical protein